MTKLDHSSVLTQDLAGLAAPDANRHFPEETYRVWACDNQVYGPVSWLTLVEWARDGRVTQDTWIYLESTRDWRLAKTIEPLRENCPPGETTMFFRRQSAADGGIRPEELRQFAVLASLPNHELAELIRLGELVNAQKDQTVIKRGDPGDAVYFLLAGSVRARIFVGGDEKTLAHISAGEFFWRHGHVHAKPPFGGRGGERLRAAASIRGGVVPVVDRAESIRGRAAALWDRRHHGPSHHGG